MYAIWPPKADNDDVWTSKLIYSVGEKLGIVEYDCGENSAWIIVITHYLRYYNMKYQEIHFDDPKYKSGNPGFKITASKDDMTLFVLGTSDVPFLRLFESLDQIESLYKNTL